MTIAWVTIEVGSTTAPIGVAVDVSDIQLNHLAQLTLSVILGSLLSLLSPDDVQAKCYKPLVQS